VKFVGYIARKTGEESNTADKEKSPLS